MLAGGRIVAFIFKITHCNHITIHFTSCMPATSRLRSGRIFMPIISPSVAKALLTGLKLYVHVGLFAAYLHIPRCVLISHSFQGLYIYYFWGDTNRNRNRKLEISKAPSKKRTLTVFIYTFSSMLNPNLES